MFRFVNTSARRMPPLPAYMRRFASQANPANKGALPAAASADAARSAQVASSSSSPFFRRSPSASANTTATSSSTIPPAMEIETELFRSRGTVWLRVLRLAVLSQVLVAGVGIPVFVAYDQIAAFLGFDKMENRPAVLDKPEPLSEEELRQKDERAAVIRKWNLSPAALHGRGKDASEGPSSESINAKIQANSPLLTWSLGERLAAGLGVAAWTAASVALLHWFARFHVISIHQLHSKLREEVLRIRWLDVRNGMLRESDVKSHSILNVEHKPSMPWWTVFVDASQIKGARTGGKPVPFKVDRDGIVPNKALFERAVLREASERVGQPKTTQ